jgi:hypothetical protein
MLQTNAYELLQIDLKNVFQRLLQKGLENKLSQEEVLLDIEDTGKQVFGDDFALSEFSI